MSAGNITRRSFVGAAAAGLLALAGCGGNSAEETAGANDQTTSQDAESVEADAVAVDEMAAPSTSVSIGGGGVLFVNPSQNPNGNTASMAAELLDGIEYETLNLIEYKVYPLGAQFDDDQFEEVWQHMCAADFLVWGSPVYWHSLAGPLKVVIDRMYDKRGGELEGKPFAFFQQGGAPTEEALAHSEIVIGRIVELFGLDSVGTSDSVSEIPALREAIQAKLAG